MDLLLRTKMLAVYHLDSIQTQGKRTLAKFDSISSHVLFSSDIWQLLIKQRTLMANICPVNGKPSAAWLIASVVGGENRAPSQAAVDEQVLLLEQCSCTLKETLVGHLEWDDKKKKWPTVERRSMPLLSENDCSYAVTTARRQAPSFFDCSLVSLLPWEEVFKSKADTELGTAKVSSVVVHIQAGGN